MINDSEQWKLRERFNPDGSILRQHQLRMLDMLKYFDSLCRENGIRYWLSSGTCIGAVRHHGFIPWDDDADVEMLREDYLKLLKIFKETEQYVLQTKDNDPYYVAPYAKLRDKKSYIEEHGQDCNYNYRGIYVDIFVLEKSNGFLAYIYHRLMWKILMYGSNIENSSLAKSLFYLYKKTFYASITIVRFLFGKIPGNKLIHTYGSGFYRNIRHMEDLFPLTYCEFEDSQFPIPGKYDSYLRGIYGDYMKLPDLDKIQPHIVKVKFLE